MIEFCIITFREFAADQLILRAMALTHGVLLTLVPLFIVVFSLFKLLGGADWFDDIVRPGLFDLLAPGVAPVVSDKLGRLIQGYAAKTIGGVGVILLIISIHTIFAAIERTFNLIWGVSAKGRLLARASIHWALVFLIPMLMACSFIATTYFATLPIAERGGVFYAFFGRLAVGAMVTLCFFLLFRLIPTTKVHSTGALIGAVATGLLFEIFKHLFIFYATTLVHYDALYGSLAIIPLLMIWVNIAWVVILLGVEISYIYQHFPQLRRQQKHAPLSRMQQDALAWCLVREALEAVKQAPHQIDLTYLSEKWGAPLSIVVESAEQLERAGILMRGKNDVYKLTLAREGATITIREVDQALRSYSDENWPWPDDKLWDETREWLKLRERRGGMRGQSIETLSEKVKSREWLDRATNPPKQ